MRNRAVLMLLTFFTAGAFPAHADIWYVDVDNTAGPWDGTSWGTAFQTIQEGVHAADVDGDGHTCVIGTDHGGSNTS